MRLSLTFLALALATTAVLAAPATDVEEMGETLEKRVGVNWIDDPNDDSWYTHLVNKWHSASRNQWPRAASKSGKVGTPNCSHPSRHCLYLKGGAYTTLIERKSFWKPNRNQVKVICERFDEVGRGRGKCSVPNNQLVAIQCDGENQEVAFVKLTGNSEFKRFESKGTQKKLGLIWSTQKRAGGHAEYKSNGKGDDLYAQCKNMKDWDFHTDNSGYNFEDNKEGN